MIPTWLILWLVLIPLLFAAQGTRRFWGSEGDEGWQLLQAAAWLGVFLFPKLNLLLCTGWSRNFPIILEQSWIIPAGMGNIVSKSKTISLGNTGHGITCNGRGLEFLGLHPKPFCIFDFLRASTDSVEVSPFPAGFPVPHFPAGSQLLRFLWKCWAPVCDRAEGRGDGGRGELGWLGGVLLGLALSQPCHSLPS